MIKTVLINLAIYFVGLVIYSVGLKGVDPLLLILYGSLIGLAQGLVAAYRGQRSK